MAENKEELLKLESKLVKEKYLNEIEAARQKHLAAMNAINTQQKVVYAVLAFVVVVHLAMLIVPLVKVTLAPCSAG